jgi:hypothetical protein
MVQSLELKSSVDDRSFVFPFLSSMLEGKIASVSVFWLWYDTGVSSRS